MKESFNDYVFLIVVYILVILLALICLFPFLNLIAVSLSSRQAVISGYVSFWPIGWDINAYQTVFRNGKMVGALSFTVMLTVVYVAVTMIMTVLCAYPLSKRHLRGRSAILMFIMFTMYFSGGMIPGYLNINSLGLINSFWSLILPGAISTYYMILMKTFFGSLPDSLEESAYIDGANDLIILVKIILPLSKAMLATLALFYAVARWNGLSDALLYINDEKMYPLQMILRQIIALNQSDSMMNDVPEAKAMLTPETIKAACLVFSMTPILLVYPWLQKYFVKGVMIGSVKG